MNPTFELFKKKVEQPIAFAFFLLLQLPAAFFVGLTLKSLNENACVVKLRYSWFSKNPFKSLYFAAQAMAAEMSTGLLAFGQIYRRVPKVSMLVVRMEVNFIKKGTGIVLFTCEDGQAIKQCIDAAIQTKQAQTLTCTSVGKNEAGETIAEFIFTWSFKAK
jgi:hypothetical protein